MNNVEIRKEFEKKLLESNSFQKLDLLKIEFFGKKGVVTQQFNKIKDLQGEDRKVFGQEVNILRKNLLDKFTTKFDCLKEEQLSKKLQQEKIDVTIPVRPSKEGKIHPISYVEKEIEVILSNMGFMVVDGPEIEDSFHNFTALNIPKNHPARDMHDTFYIDAKHHQATETIEQNKNNLKQSENNKDKLEESQLEESDKKILLRTHTSSVQIRTMKESKPPLKIISYGKTFRSDSDQTHTPMFHQLEGLYIDKNVSLGNLKYCIFQFIKEFFAKDDIEIRFRSSFFPFTEPSFEVDIGYQKQNNIIKVGGSDNFLEIMGCGMVHPNVLDNVNIDSAIYNGFAFGVGIERLAMLKYGISDLRTFFDNDLRWLNSFGFKVADYVNRFNFMSNSF